MNLLLTQTAKERILETKKPQEFVRISLISGGCHGFSYKFQFDANLEEDDLTIKNEDGAILVAIKKKFAEKIQDLQLDFKKTISASYFVIESPNFETKCGCGTSFSLKS